MRTKKPIAALLCIVFAAASVPVPFGYAAETAASVFRFSNDPGDTFRVCAEDGRLVFYDLPKGEKFNYLNVFLADEGGKNTGYAFTARDAGNTAAYSLKGVADGAYYVQLYNSDAPANGKISTYKGYVYGNTVKIKVAGGAAEFVPPPNYQGNAAICNEKRSDKAALDHYLRPSEGVQSDDGSVFALAKEITAGKNNDYTKVKAVHDWVCDNIWYDFDAYHGRSPLGDTSAIGVLKSKKSVSDGYAALTAALLRAAGIPAKCVSGYADGGRHVWNEAYADGRWIIIDATWDSGNKLENGISAREGMKHLYFDPTLYTFSGHHRYADYSEDMIPPPPASDRPSPWAAAQVNAALAAKLVPQALQSKYAQPITRAEFCALAVTLHEAVTGKEITGRKAFSDTNDVNVQKMAAIGAVNGSGGKFNPGGALTREEAAVLIVNLAASLGKPLPKHMSDSADKGSFSTWAADAIGSVQAAGIMTGAANNAFLPKDAFTREQSMITVSRLWDLVG